MQKYASSPRPIAPSRGRSPYASTPLLSHSKRAIHQIILPNVRASSVSPFKQISAINGENSNNQAILWKNRYESLQRIYQLEIEELRKFYNNQNFNEEIKQLKKDNRILSEYIKKNTDEIEILLKENLELKCKLDDYLNSMGKIEDLIMKNAN